MRLSLRRTGPVSAEVRSALELHGGERVLASASEPATGVTVVATTHHLYAVSPAGERVLARSWHEVDAGSWSSELGQLTVTWVDGSRPAKWTLGQSSLLPETVRERVQASVVLSQLVDLGGKRRGRAVIRQDLATGDLVEQVMRGRATRPDDVELTAALAGAAAYLREQVGR